MGPECNFPPSGESSAGCYSDDQRWRVEALFAWGMIGHTFISVSVSHSIVLFSGIMNDNTHDDGGFHSIFEKSLISIFLSILHVAWPPVQLEQKFFVNCGGSPI